MRRRGIRGAVIHPNGGAFSEITLGARNAIIAGAGGAAHLPGMVAAMTSLPVMGVPVQSKSLDGIDSLLSIVQMPAGIPVHTFAIGRAGAINAALGAAAILALGDAALARPGGECSPDVV